MVTYGGNRPTVKDNEVLTAQDFNDATRFWVTDELPDNGKDGDVVFVVGDSPVGAAVAAPGLVHLHTEKFSNVGSVGVDNVFSSEYENYRIVFFGVLSSAEANLTSRLRLNGVAASGNNYFYLQLSKGVNQSDYEQAGRGDISWTLGRIGASGTSSCSFDLFSPALSDRTTFHSQNYGNGTTTGFVQSGAGTHAVTIPHDGIEISAAAFTMSGHISVYGYSEGGN